MWHCATRWNSRSPSLHRGHALENIDATFVKAGAIPWFKIDVKNTGFQDGPTGGDTLSKTRSSSA